MFTDCCLLPSSNPLSDRTEHSHVLTASSDGGQAGTQSLLVPSALVGSVCHQPLYLDFSYLFCFCCFSGFLAWFCTFLPIGPPYLDFIAKNKTHQRLFSPFSLPFLLVLVNSEDLTITSVLQKCLNIFLRPLWIFFLRKLKDFLKKHVLQPLFSGTLRTF